MTKNRDEILSKTLTTGGSGVVASYVHFGTKANRADFDITDLSQVMNFVKKHKPQVILHLAAETDLAKCQTDPSQAYLVNAVGTYNLAMTAKMVGAKMVYVSTDAVFPSSAKSHAVGEEGRPESIYGHSKYLGELAVKGVLSDFIIARTSWVFGGGPQKDKKFVGNFIGQLHKTEVKAVNDQFNSPTFAGDLVETLKNLITEKRIGTFHIVNQGLACRYDMALVIAETLQKKPKILSVNAATFGLSPYQQSSGGLVGNLELRPWQFALTDYVQSEWVGKI